MDYIDATIEMKLKEDGNPKFEIVLPHIVEFNSDINKHSKNIQLTISIKYFFFFINFAQSASIEKQIRANATIFLPFFVFFDIIN